MQHQYNYHHSTNNTYNDNFNHSATPNSAPADPRDLDLSSPHPHPLIFTRHQNLNPEHYHLDSGNLPHFPNNEHNWSQYNHFDNHHHQQQQHLPQHHQQHHQPAELNFHSFPSPSPFPPPRLTPPPTFNFKQSSSHHPSTGTRIGLAGSLDPTTGIYYRTPEHPRLRTAQACEKCRTRKAKCSGEHPSCKRCIQRGFVCEYKEGRGGRGPNKPKPKNASATTTTPAASSTTSRRDQPANSVTPPANSSCSGIGPSQAAALSSSSSGSISIDLVSKSGRSASRRRTSSNNSSTGSAEHQPPPLGHGRSHSSNLPTGDLPPLLQKALLLRELEFNESRRRHQQQQQQQHQQQQQMQIGAFSSGTGLGGMGVSGSSRRMDDFADLALHMERQEAASNLYRLSTGAHGSSPMVDSLHKPHPEVQNNYLSFPTHAPQNRHFVSELQLRDGAVNHGEQLHQPHYEFSEYERSQAPYHHTSYTPHLQESGPSSFRSSQSLTPPMHNDIVSGGAPSVQSLHHPHHHELSHPLQHHGSPGETPVGHAQYTSEGYMPSNGMDVPHQQTGMNYSYDVGIGMSVGRGGIPGPPDDVRVHATGALPSGTSPLSINESPTSRGHEIPIDMIDPALCAHVPISHHANVHNTTMTSGYAAGADDHDTGAPRDVDVNVNVNVNVNGKVDVDGDGAGNVNVVDLGVRADENDDVKAIVNGDVSGDGGVNVGSDGNVNGIGVDPGVNKGGGVAGADFNDVGGRGLGLGELELGGSGGGDAGVGPGSGGTDEGIRSGGVEGQSTAGMGTAAAMTMGTGTGGFVDLPVMDMYGLRGDLGSRVGGSELDVGMGLIGSESGVGLGLGLGLAATSTSTSGLGMGSSTESEFGAEVGGLAGPGPGEFQVGVHQSYERSHVEQ